MIIRRNPKIVLVVINAPMLRFLQRGSIRHVRYLEALLI